MRTLLILRYINGLSYAEIEKITGIEKTKIKSRIHYSLDKMKKLYFREGGKAE
jgi:DNA-directed RNA polymerase specialized sigma24 family protein